MNSFQSPDPWAQRSSSTASAGTPEPGDYGRQLAKQPKSRWMWIMASAALLIVIGTIATVAVSVGSRDHVASPPTTTTNPPTPLVLPLGRLSGPQGIAVDADGNAFIADMGTSANENQVLKLATDSSSPSALPFGGAGVVAVAVDQAGTVYAVDGVDGRVVKLEEHGDIPLELPFTGLNQPNGIAVDNVGSVYVADSYNNRILKLAAGAPEPTELPLSGLNTPFGVAIGPEGSVYVADSYNDRVLKLAPGSARAVELPFDGISGPNAVAVDASGALYVSSYGNQRVLKLESDATNQVELPFSGLQKPWGVAVDTDGSVYVTDTGSKKVLKLAKDR